MGQTDFDLTQGVYEIPKLNSLQDQAYREFLQSRRGSGFPESRRAGLDFQETFPIRSHDGKVAGICRYRIDPPVRDMQNCRDRASPMAALSNQGRAQVEDRDSIEEEIYVGEIPEMIGGGEFIVNGVERTVIIQISAGGADLVTN